ncbi:RraA family protein [Amaricoccus sp.]|uniref:RraA family protein n=1 Tax=Amaricoccus sp. TaxID=1872485 RepID=UPI001B5CCC1A|nr:RraA family protein [Amaricoccus sp.]MBP7001631.1 RraA family protein [Amaricoccus sp.]
MSIARHAPAIAPIPEALLARWRRVPPAIVADLAPERQIDPAIRPLLPPGRQPALFGRAVTVRCDPPDFGAVLLGVEAIGPGEVLMIAAGGDPVTAMIGEILGGHIHAKGAAGLVCDGAIRDVDTLAGLEGLSAWSRSITPRGPKGAAGGELGGPVTIGGCEVRPGDLVIGDGDGLVALSPDALADLIDAAEAKLALEAEWIRRLAAGETMAKIFGIG